MPHLVLLVEDDDQISAPLIRTLQREEYLVERVSAGLAAVERVQAGGVDLVLLDLGLPDIDGLEVCRRIRAGGYIGGVMILTARGGELDRVVGLDVGADDYLAKPFGLAEMMARSRALLRRAAPSAGTTADAPAGAVAAASAPTFERRGGILPADPTVRPYGRRSTDRTGGPADRRGGDASDRRTPGPSDRTGSPSDRASQTSLRVDKDGRRVWVGPNELTITAKEFDVLALLHSSPGAVFTRERVMDEVWDENWFGSTKTLDTTIGRLRQKLEETGTTSRIVTVRGVGFRLENQPDA